MSEKEPKLLYPIDIPPEDQKPSVLDPELVDEVLKNPVAYRDGMIQKLDDLWKKCRQTTGNNNAPENTQAEPEELAAESAEPEELVAKPEEE